WGIKQARAHASHELVCDPVGNAETRSEVEILRPPGVAIIAVSVLEFSEDVGSESCTDRVDCFWIKVGQAIEAFRRRPLVFIAQTSCDGQAISGAPLILDIETNGMEAHGGIHRDARGTAPSTEQHGGNRVAGGEIVGAQYGLTWTAGRPWFTGGEIPAKVKRNRPIGAVVHESYVVIGAELQSVSSELLCDVSQPRHVGAHKAVISRKLGALIGI